ncbi:tyrosine-type recombinase/integrase [Lysinibacillus sp. SGAir0095]|uniref:tyrosine-type recombinase/integrase n=1 Tax=Lysinibacillus sp. SGAir0095 TaxID=2070463 RepID=UPI0010CCFE31|nr:tyrosine-type recombinase/integrase [Lysinibacillus sp. SGAir0095]QCR32433.1 hypothetical protein C1N55_09690 [Lysinibacillus sp. SGAir0095]
MDELVTNYRAYLQSLSKSPHTIKQYGIDTHQFLQFMNEHHYTFNDPLGKIVDGYNEYLEVAFSSVASINRKRASLQHFLTFLKQRDIIGEIPKGLFKPMRTEKQAIQTLSVNQVKLASNYWCGVFEAAEDTEFKWIALRNFCIMNIMLETGVKPSEIVGLKWSHIMDNEITFIQNKKIRKLSLSMTILKWLHLFHLETEALLPLSKNCEFVWLGLGNKQNEPITVKTIERIFQSTSEKLGFKVTATSLRYTLIDKEVKQLHGKQLEDFMRYGYSRKSVLKERLNLINKSP